MHRRGPPIRPLHPLAQPDAGAGPAQQDTVIVGDVRTRHPGADTFSLFTGVLGTIERLVPADYTVLMTDGVVLRMPSPQAIRSSRSALSCAILCRSASLRGVRSNPSTAARDDSYG